MLGVLQPALVQHVKLTAIAPDKFRGSIGTVTFVRDAAGAIEALSVNQERVWDLRFAKK